jgi:hypothetical protein
MPRVRIRTKGTKSLRHKSAKRDWFFRAIAFLCFCAIFSSCADKPPIPEKNFVEIYVQLQLLDAQYAAQPSLQKTKADSVMKAFNVNDSLLNSMLSWYSRKPERWHEFFAQVQDKMNETKAAYLKERR